MEPVDLANLPIGIQTALGAGYLAYAIAYGGLRERHTAQDAIFLTLAFGLLPGLVMTRVGDRPIGWAVGLAVASAMCLGALWRRWGRALAARALSAAKVHHDDGLQSGWTAFIQGTKALTQVAVFLKDGQVLRCEDLGAYAGFPHQGFILGSDGSVVLPVEIEDDTQGERRDAERVTDPLWGTRLTYVPASEVARVDLRVL